MKIDFVNSMTIYSLTNIARLLICGFILFSRNWHNHSLPTNKLKIRKNIYIYAYSNSSERTSIFKEALIARC